MDELIRTRMHEALEVEQPDGGLRSRILSSLPAERLDRADRSGVIPLGRRTELVAAIAAVVLAAIVIGSFAYIRAATHPHTVTPPIPSASPSSPSGQLPTMISASQFVSPQIGWISEVQPTGTGPSVIFKTTDGGQHWQKQLRWDGPDGAQQMRFHGNDGLVVGMTSAADDLIFRTADGGSHWQAVSLPLGPTPTGEPAPLIYFRDPLEGWVISTVSGTTPPLTDVFHTTDGGQHWTQTAQFDLDVNTMGPGTQGRIEFADQSNGWWVNLCPGSGPCLMNTRDGGKTWTAVKLARPAMSANELASALDSPHFFNATDGVLIVEVASALMAPSPSPAPPAFYIYTTADAGAHWSAPRSLPVLGKGAQGFSFLDAAHSWMVSDQTVAVSADEGQNWTLYRAVVPPTVNLTTNIPDLPQFLTPTDGWVAGTTQPGGQAGLYRTVDGGAHWVAIPMPAPDLVK